MIPQPNTYLELLAYFGTTKHWVSVFALEFS